MPGPRPLVAALGGLLTGALALLALWVSADPRSLAVLGSGYGILQQALDGDVAGWSGARLLAMVALLKIVATSCTIGAGGSAGVFGPSMVIGGGVGGAVGIACHQWGLIENPQNLVIVGMCGFFAGAAKTPISTIVMVTEMTGSYRLLLPAMWVCGLTFLLSRRWALYRSQVPHRALSPAHAGEYQVALLEKMRVGDVFTPGPVETVPVGMPMEHLVHVIAGSREDYFPVVDDAGTFVGVLSVRDVREFTFDASLHHVAIAGDVMSTPPITVTPKDDLHVAMDRLDSRKLDELPVVDAADGNRLLGRLTRRDVGRAYGRRLQELRTRQRADTD